MGYWLDVRYALRWMRKSPGFTALAILVIGLGVGATSAVYGVVDAVLLDPLPFPEPGRLVLVHSVQVASGSEGALSFPDFRDLRDRSRTTEEMAAFGEESLVLRGNGDGADSEGSARVRGELATPAYFSLLGAKPVLGRAFTAQETYPPIAEPVAVLGYELFRNRFSADASIVGRRIRINDVPFTVVGVLPAGFRGISGHAELFVPMAVFDALHPELVRYDILENRGTRWHSVLARLRPGVTAAAAEGELRTLSTTLSEEYPDSNSGRSIAVTPAFDEIVGGYEPSVLLMAAAVALFLLLTCANLANLFLGRVLSRTGEVSLRSALGATRSRLARQLITEAVLFGLAGGLVGALIARWALALLLNLAPVELPDYIVASFDLRVFAFALAVSILASAAFGLAPALAVRRLSLHETARAGFGRKRAQSYLVLAEIALSTLLLVGAGLVGKSFHRMQRFEPGFTSKNLLTMEFYLPASTSPSERLDRLVDRIRNVPGVLAASVSSHLYFGGGYMSGGLTVEGYQPSSPRDDLRSYRQFVLPDYFRAMGIPILTGRDFDERDSEGGPLVVVVNDSFARKMWPGESPLGKRVAFGEAERDENGEVPWRTVVGVSGDVAGRLRLADNERLPQIYLPAHQGGDWARALVVRTSAEDPTLVVPALRSAVLGLDPGIALYSIAPMDDLVARSRAMTRYLSYLLGAFAGLALVLAAVGLFGVVSFSVRRATHEIGVRLALGATRPSLIALVLTRSALMAVAGLAVGLGAAVALSRMMASLLYEVEPVDPSTYVAVLLVMSAVVLLASLIPAVRAASLDPVAALGRDG